MYEIEIGIYFSMIIQQKTIVRDYSQIKKYRMRYAGKMLK